MDSAIIDAPCPPLPSQAYGPAYGPPPPVCQSVASSDALFNVWLHIPVGGISPPFGHWKAVAQSAEKGCATVRFAFLEPRLLRGQVAITLEAASISEAKFSGLKFSLHFFCLSRQEPLFPSAPSHFTPWAIITHQGIFPQIPSMPPSPPDWEKLARTDDNGEGVKRRLFRTLIPCALIQCVLFFQSTKNFKLTQILALPQIKYAHNSFCGLSNDTVHVPNGGPLCFIGSVRSPPSKRCPIFVR